MSDEEGVRKQYGKPLTKVATESKIYTEALEGEFVPIQVLRLMPRFILNTDHKLARVDLSTGKNVQEENKNILSILDLQEKVGAKYGQHSSATPDCSVRGVSLFMKASAACKITWRDSEKNQIISLDWMTAKGAVLNVTLSYQPVPSDF